jgi:hypothetical protein
MPVCVCKHFLYPSFVDGHLGCLQILPIENNAAMKMEVQIFLQHNDFSPFGYLSRSVIAGSYGNSIFNV